MFDHRNNKSDYATKEIGTWEAAEEYVREEQQK